MHFTIQDLLDYAQIKADKFRKTITKFNIVETVQKVIQMQQKQADEKNVNLCLEFENVADRSIDPMKAAVGSFEEQSQSPEVCTDE